VIGGLEKLGFNIGVKFRVKKSMALPIRAAPNLAVRGVPGGKNHYFIRTIFWTDWNCPSLTLIW